MRRTLFTVLALTLVLGCSSSRTPAGLTPPEIQMMQVGDYSFTLQYTGPITISYRVAIANPSSESIRLRQMKFSNVGSGAYSLRNDPHFFNRDIPSGKTLVTTVAIPAFSRGGRTMSREPVTIRGIAYFESELGNFQKVFFQNFRPDVRGYE